MHTTGYLANNSQEIVGISLRVTDCSTTIKDIAGRLDTHTSDMLAV